MRLRGVRDFCSHSRYFRRRHLSSSSSSSLFPNPHHNTLNPFHMTSGSKTRSVAIVGAGPVGALMAVYLANRGWNVHVYETRPGPATFGALPCPSALAPHAPLTSTVPPYNL